MSKPDERRTVEIVIDAVVNASRTATAGGGLQGYRHMIERIAYRCMSEHGLVRTDEMLRQVVASLEALEERLD